MSEDGAAWMPAVGNVATIMCFAICLILPGYTSDINVLGVILLIHCMGRSLVRWKHRYVWSYTSKHTDASPMLTAPLCFAAVVITDVFQARLLGVFGIVYSAAQD
ncbi:unnamed protein product [Microthlaspi erraticum]|uniref:Uncharacterized protein n=1 Tax=Microthlaspi erraticum TaxID=1685480 RepID=A0A6D2IY38_9BRAS|nr:unnamed protein product [Microthlaspi erraticum]